MSHATRPMSTSQSRAKSPSLTHQGALQPAQSVPLPAEQTGQGSGEESQTEDQLILALISSTHLWCLCHQPWPRWLQYIQQKATPKDKEPPKLNLFGQKKSTSRLQMRTANYQAPLMKHDYLKWDSIFKFVDKFLQGNREEFKPLMAKSQLVVHTTFQAVFHLQIQLPDLWLPQLPGGEILLAAVIRDP